VGKRTAAPRRKAGGKKGVKDNGEAAAQEPDVEVDEDGVPVDPNEPRYCVCNGVSFGEMIACENNQVCEPFLLCFVVVCFGGVDRG
jgi:hypothetical protein